MMPTGAAVPVACPIASPWTGPAAPLPAQLVRDGLLSLGAAMQVHGRGPGSGVPHPLHQLAKVRTRIRREHVPGMAQIVEVHRR